jgi:hypothetical protein
MYLVLFVFGTLLTVAGVVLGTSGVSIHDRAFDPSLVTPGVVAAAGGLLLIGFGFALRVLQRIELALATRPMPRAIRPAEAAATAEASTEAARIPFSSKSMLAGPPPSASVDARQPQHLRVQFPSLAKLDSALAVHETDSAPPKAPLRVNEAFGELNGGRAVRQRNGNASPRTAPRLDSGSRPWTPSERSKGPAFDALWPKAPRSPQAVQPPAALTASPPGIEPEQEDPEPTPAAVVTPAQDETPAAASVLKSGVVDGMAYTLFSDGSIEAQLPQGTLRFGSITELRIHIEQSPSDTAVS